MSHMKPNKEAIKEHLNFLFGSLSEYSDGIIELRWSRATDGALTNHAHFNQTSIDKAIDKAFEVNSVEGQNVYVCASLLHPDTFPGSFAKDDDAYVTPCGWVDIDDHVKPETLKGIYSKASPALVVVTGRHPHIRTQLWFKYDEPETDQDTIREVNTALCQNFRGDPSVVNPSRVMRVGGSIAWPKKSGRIIELTEVKTPSNPRIVLPEQLLAIYPPSQGMAHITDSPQHTAIIQGGIDGSIKDGRDKYMSDMVYASICNLSKSGVIPTQQQVYDDVWPVYSRKVSERGGKTLDQDGRGQRALKQKIASKLRLLSSGRLKVSIHENKQQTENYNTETGEVIETIVKPSGMTYLKYVDCKPPLKSTDFVQGLFGNNQLSVTYGESNCGKTFFKTDLSFHVAMGQKWRGRRVEGGGVIYAALEGSYGLMNRMAAFKQHTGVNDIPFAMVSTQIDFMDPNGNVNEFIDLIKRAADDLGSVKMVVIDTLARALTGGDENSGKDMGMLVTHADKIRYATNAHVNFIHHSGKDLARGARGHSSLRAAVDTEIEISREKDADFSIMRVVKQREMEMGEDMAFSLKRIVLGMNQYGEEISSCVVVPVEVQQQDKKVYLKPKTKNALDVLNNVIIENGYIAQGEHYPKGAKIVSEESFSTALERCGMISDEKKVAMAQFHRIKKDLIDNNVIRIYDKKIWVCLP